jgi:hypothetical protein
MQHTASGLDTLEIPISIKISNLYWGWWDLINTAIFVIFVAVMLIYLSLNLMGVLPASLSSLLVIDKNTEFGAGLLGFTASAGGAAGLWILSNSDERWTVINKVIHVNNIFLTEFSMSYINNDIDELGPVIRAYLWTVSSLNDKILYLNPPAQRSLYSALISAHIIVDAIEKHADLTEARSIFIYNRLSMLSTEILLASIYLNSKPCVNPTVLSKWMSSLQEASTRDERVRNLLANVCVFIRRTG